MTKKDDNNQSQGVRLDSTSLPPTIDLGLAEGTPRSAKESPLRDYARVFDALPDSAVVLNLDGNIEAINRNFRLITGCTEKQIVGRSFSEFIVSKTQAENGQKKAVERYIIQSILEENVSTYAFDLELKDRDGKPIPVNFSGSPILNEDGNIVGIVGIGRDLTETRNMMEKLERAETLAQDYSSRLEDQMGERMAEIKERTRILEELSVTDELTKLYNRRYVFKRLFEELHRSNRYGNPFSLVALDIDHFKVINDTYGHQAGDMVLYELSGILRGSIRQTDVVARTGGEEFMIMLPSIREGHGYLFCERLREKVKAFQFTYLPEGVHPTISMGIADYPRDGVHSIDDLIRLSDNALYKAKETRNTTICASNVKDDAIETVRDK